MRKMLFQAAILVWVSIARAACAELDGITLPDRQDIAGFHLVLNGLGLRTYSILRIHVYVAGLYLEHRSDDGQAILNSKQPKLLLFAFLHDVDAMDARKSWREALERNCAVPCNVPTASIDRFLAAVPSVRSGDASSLLFTPRRMDFFMNGRFEGRVTDPEFVRLILATFIGEHPTSVELKRGLLGISE